LAPLPGRRAGQPELGRRRPRLRLRRHHRGQALGRRRRARPVGEEPGGRQDHRAGDDGHQGAGRSLPARCPEQAGAAAGQVQGLHVEEPATVSFMLPSLRATLRTALLAGVALAVAPAAAQTYPEQPIRLIIPFTPGGGTDNLSRLVGNKLAEKNRWSIVMENKAGASGTIGIGEAVKAKPDGYTI